MCRPLFDYLRTNPTPPPPPGTPHHLRLALVIALIIFFLSLSVHCRRRNQRRVYLSRAQQTQPGSGGGAGYGLPYGSANSPPPFSPQYPPPAHSGLESPYAYDPATRFAPVRGISVFSLRFPLMPLDVRALVALCPTAAVLSAATWRAPSHIVPEMKRSTMGLISFFGQLRRFFYPLLAFIVVALLLPS